MEVKLSKGGCLEAFEYNKNYGDVSERAHQYLNNVVSFGEGGITIGDIYDLIKKDEILQKIYRRNFVESFIEYLDKVPNKKRLALYEKEQKKPNGIEYVELKRFYDYDVVNQVLNLNNCAPIHVSGMSKELKRSCDGYKKGTRINYSMTGVEFAKLYYMPVKYLELSTANQDNLNSARPVDRRIYAETKEFIVPNLTLNELIEAVSWELSFHGTPADAKEFVKSLTVQVKTYKAQDSFQAECKRIIDEIVNIFMGMSVSEEAIKETKDAFIAVSEDNELANTLTEKILENKYIVIGNGFTEKTDIFKRLITNTIYHLVNKGDDALDVEKLIDKSVEVLTEKQKLEKDFAAIAKTVSDMIATDVPVDEAHEERNQIVINKISSTEKAILTKEITEKELSFIVDELEDLVKDIKKGLVSEIFIPIDRINRELNSDLGKRYEEILYGFKKLPENINREAFSKLLSCVPDSTDMDTLIHVMFQDKAELNDDTKGTSAYDYRLISQRLKPYRGFFRAHDNKALAAKEAKEHLIYINNMIEESKMTDVAKSIIERGKTLFSTDDDTRLKDTHKLAVKIRPDISLIRWKTIVPKAKKVKIK